MEVQMPTTGELHQMWGNNPIAIMQQQKQIDLANLFANQSLQKGQQDIDLSAQMNPIKVRQAGLNADTTEAQLPGYQADARVKGVNANIAEATQQDQIKTKLSELAKQASDNDLSMLENQGQRLAYSRNPQERALGLEMIRMHKDLIREKDKINLQSEAQIRLANVQGRNQKDLMQMQIDAGRFNKAGGAARSIEEQLASGKLNYEKAATLLNNAAFMADMEGDAEKAMYYRNLANDYHSKFIAGKQAGAQVGVGAKPNLEQFDIETNKTPPAAQFTPPVRPNAPSADQNVQIFQQAFGGYDPARYEYRIGPNGVPQRRLKQGQK